VGGPTVKFLAAALALHVMSRAQLTELMVLFVVGSALTLAVFFLARRIATTRAVDECVITRLEKATMIATIHNEPEFSELFMSYLLTRNSRIEEDLIDQLFNSSEKRLARLLLLLANFGKEGRPEPIVGKFSQETLAEMIGTTRSRVSFFMNKFRKLGFIEYNGRLEVHNSLLNMVLRDKPEIKTRNETIDAE